MCLGHSHLRNDKKDREYVLNGRGDDDDGTGHEKARDSRDIKINPMATTITRKKRPQKIRD